ncbi:MAG: hypothetical protein QNJ36_09200 [Calothrix sp. MO_167.B42]|nr:hypothetical protein [Calothrix sp. MO_167.B42]
MAENQGKLTIVYLCLDYSQRCDRNCERTTELILIDATIYKPTIAHIVDFFTNIHILICSKSDRFQLIPCKSSAIENWAFIF